MTHSKNWNLNLIFQWNYLRKESVNSKISNLAIVFSVRHGAEKRNLKARCTYQAKNVHKYTVPSGLNFNLLITWKKKYGIIGECANLNWTTYPYTDTDTDKPKILWLCNTREKKSLTAQVNINVWSLITIIDHKNQTINDATVWPPWNDDYSCMLSMSFSCIFAKWKVA